MVSGKLATGVTRMCKADAVDVSLGQMQKASWPGSVEEQNLLPPPAQYVANESCN